MKFYSVSTNMDFSPGTKEVFVNDRVGNRDFYIKMIRKGPYKWCISSCSDDLYEGLSGNALVARINNWFPSAGFKLVEEDYV